MTLIKYLTLVNLIKTNYNVNITEVEGKIPSNTDLTTINAARIKNPNVSDLVKKASYDTKILDIDTKYFTASDYNKFTAEILDKKKRVS